MAITGTDETFEDEVLNSDLPVLVDFWAPWCGPCRVIAPLLEQLAEEYEDTLKVVKVDVDDHKANAAAFGVQSIPTLLVFKDGEVVERKVGAAGGLQGLRDLVDPHLGGDSE